MDPNDPIMIQRQQHEENLRRMQQQEHQRRLEQAENQRRLDHQQLIEDEEREELLRQERAQALAAGTGEEEPVKKGRRWPFGAKKNRDDFDADPDLQGDELDGLERLHRDDPLEPTTAPASGMGTIFWVVALLLAGALAWFFVPRMFKPSDKAAPAVVQKARDPSLPLAAPGDPLSVATGPGLPDAAGPAVSVTDPVAVPPTADAALALESAPSRALPESQADSTANELASALADPVETATPASVTTPRVESDAMELRVAALEASLASLQQELWHLQETAANNAQQAKQAATAPRRANRARSSNNRARNNTPAAQAPAPASVSAEQRVRDQMQAQLLAIDVWDGRPSVVVGTGVPGDKRVRVLQPGEQLHGVGLHSVDVAAGTATFSVGSGSLVTLDVKEANQP